jgi:hypothetical protein
VLNTENIDKKYIDPDFYEAGIILDGTPRITYTYEFAQALREENLKKKTRGIKRLYDLIPQEGFQEKVLLSEADVIIIGGKKGGGKSWVALYRMLEYAQTQDVRMYAFRKYKDDVENSIWDASKRVFPGFAVPTKSNFTWTFPSGGTVTMTHIADAKEIQNRFRGVESVCIDIEELPEHTVENLNVLRELAAACRSTSGEKPTLIATCNPVDEGHPLYHLLSWYINPDTHKIIPERSGEVRYLFFYGQGADEFVMGNSYEDVYNDPRCTEAIDRTMENTGVDYKSLITTFTFIGGSYSENKILQATDKTYLSKLALGGASALVRDTEGLWTRIEDGESQLSHADIDMLFSNAERRDGYMRASCDVALTGDFLVIWAFDGHHICDMEIRRGGLSDDVIPFIEGFLSKNGVRKENFTYDSNGLGLWLKESSQFKGRAVEFNNKSAPSDNRLWNNLKSESAEKFVRALKAGEFSISTEILSRKLTDKRGHTMTVGERIRDERRAIRRKENAAGGRYEIISKPEMKRIIGHSPDFIEGLFMVMPLMEKKPEMRKRGLCYM